jgi:DNA invertase Pin-like site-specific DNA recombinase
MLIPAKRQVGNNERAEENPRLRVAAYCRVSTDSDEQATSYDAQVKHYTEYIQRNPEWEFAGIYADDGISGTNTKKRNEFNRMIDDCMAGNIDMIITKSISRFARNTLDCLKYIRQLKGKNIPVYFEKESINTLDAKGEVLLTIMASLAQQESQSLSQNVKLGLQYRYQQGKVQVNHNRFLGYTKDENGHLIIDLEQAEIVKRIYREYLEGSSMGRIAAGLEKDGILTGAGNTKWHTSTINKILRNLSLSILIQCNDSGYVKKSEKYSAFSVFDRWRRSVDVLLNSRSFYARRAKKAKCTHNHTIAFYRVIVGLSCNDMQLKKPDTVS